jgi:hypothetical protein
MIKLNFNSAEEFEKLFKLKDKLVTDAIVQAIEEAMQGNKKTAKLFECSFENVEMAYEISLPSREWKVALQSCLDHYHVLGLTDEQIDTWKLLEAAKNWH